MADGLPLWCRETTLWHPHPRQFRAVLEPKLATSFWFLTDASDSLEAMGTYLSA